MNRVYLPQPPQPQPLLPLVQWIGGMFAVALVSAVVNKAANDVADRLLG